MSEARIYERGYRRYEGPRRGPSAAAWTLYKHSLARALGPSTALLRKAARFARPYPSEGDLAALGRLRLADADAVVILSTGEARLR